MSFTVMRYKDGKPAPIKMSIWDAFKGAPPPRPRPTKLKPCPCCKKVHPKNPSQADIATNSKENGGVEASNETKSDAKNDERSSHSDKEVEPYTAEDDKKLTELKTAGETWKNIQATLGKKSLSQLQARWKVIKPADNGSANDKKDSGGDAAEKKKKEEEEKRVRIEKDKAEGQAKKQQQQQGKTNEVTKDNGKKNKTHEPGEANLKMFATRYDRHKWAAAASKHFDLTGQRITADMARKMAEGN